MMDSDVRGQIFSADLRQEYQAFLDWLTSALVKSEGLEEPSAKDERELAKIWSKWDALESVRKQQDVGLGSLQEDIAGLRQKDKERKYLRSTLAREGSTQQFPLWTCVEHFIGSQDINSRLDLSTHSAEAYWNAFQNLVNSRSGFWDRLSTVQQVTWQILHDWWNAAYQNEDLAAAAREAIHALACTPSENLPLDPPSDTLESAKAKDSLYHFSGFYLFWQEFNYSSWVPEASDTWLHALEEVRTCFVTQARSQKIAHSFYTKSRNNEKLNPSPYVEDPSSHCPWLPDVDHFQDRPHYLWDVENECSVVVNELVQVPDYVCISHTWGRWRQPAEMDVVIRGVPWKVPRNSRFDVQTLPAHFKTIKQPYAYIWFDLFCIPQNKCDVYWKQLADQEISRQSSIFRCSSMCLAWFSEVGEWSSLLKALNWMSALYLHKSASGEVYEGSEMLAEISALAEEPIELMVTRLASKVIAVIRDKTSGQKIPESEYEASIWPSPWFSSLWTLQEAVLCPSLILLNKKWEPLTDGAGSAIPLNALLSFTNLCFILDARPTSHEPNLSTPFYFDYGIRSTPDFKVNGWEKWPLGAQQTLKLCVLTRMQRLLELPSTPFIFVLANLRESTGDRAPAIMSALGVTDWYPDPESPLILGMYPLSFIREAAAKLGACFYGIHNHRVWISDPVGSLLPFTKPQGWLTGAMDVPEVPPLQREDHTAVKNWIINTNASVTIKKAGILVASGRADSRNIQGSIGVIANNSNQVAFTGNIIDWLDGVREELLTFAVALYDDMYHQSGVILQGKIASPIVLVKIGSYSVLEQPMPGTEEVDWVVL